MTENEKDKMMLQADPAGLIMKYQETVKIIVRKYIASGLFKSVDFEDVVQEINASLLSKSSAMQAQYNGIASFRTYFSVIVRNICLKEHERLKRRADVDIETIGDFPDFDRVEDRVFIEQEIHRFRSIISLYQKKRPKLLLSLKIRHRIPLTKEDLTDWFPQLGATDQMDLLTRFGVNYDRLEDRDIYRALAPVMNKLEGKRNSADALRKWTDSKIQEILRLLNGSPPHSRHSSETLKILVEDYFSPFLIKK